MNEEESIAWGFQELPVAVLADMLGLSRASVVRARRNLKGRFGELKPSSNRAQTGVKPSSNQSQVAPIAPSSLDIPYPSDKEAVASKCSPTREEAFEDWASNIHPVQLNYARKHSISVEDTLIDFRAYCLGTEKGLQVVNFGQRFWGFLKSEKLRAEANAAHSSDLRRRRDQRDKEIRERHEEPPGAREAREERAREKQARRGRLAELEKLYPGVPHVTG